MESCVRGYMYDIYQELWEAVIVCSPVKIFRAFNFHHLGNWRKFFHGENFPIYGITLLTMANLTGLLKGVKYTSKVQNRKVAKSRVVYTLIKTFAPP